MSSETPHGYPYPEDSDRVMDGAAAMQALAEAVDTQLRASAAGYSDVPVAAGAVTGVAAVTLPTGRFSQPPAVTASGYNSSTYFMSTSSVTTAGFNITARHYQATAVTNPATLTAAWVATEEG